MNEWATVEEINRVREIAEEGLAILRVLSSTHLTKWRLLAQEGFLDLDDEAREKLEFFCRDTLPRIAEFFRFAPGGPGEEESSDKQIIKRVLRTIQRTSKTSLIPAFRRNYEKDSFGEVETRVPFQSAHEAAIHWTVHEPDLLRFATPSVPYEEYAEVLAKDEDEADKFGRLIAGLRSSEDFRRELPGQIISEWRAALEFVQQLGPSTSGTVPALPSPEAIPSDSVPDSQESLTAWPAEGGGESMRLDLDKWTKYAMGPLSEHCDKESSACWGRREFLYGDQEQTTWLVICAEKNAWATPPRRVTYRTLTANEAAEWCHTNEQDPPEALAPLLTSRPLTPNVLEAPATEAESDPNKPVWDKDEGKLSVGGEVVATFVPRATNARPVLEAFQEEGWPRRIDDPLGSKTTDPLARLREALRTLNSKQATIRFSGDGTGEGIVWEFCGSSAADNSHTTPSENP